MTTQLHLAYGIVDMRALAGPDRALLRSVQLARQDERRARRARRTAGR